MSSKNLFLFSGGLWLLVTVTLAVYWSGLTGIFLVDDANQLAALNHNGGVNNWHNFLYFIFGNNSGVLGRPISMLSFFNQ